MMNKEVFAAIFWRNETKALVCVEPFNCTFTHEFIFFLLLNIRSIRILFARKLVESNKRHPKNSAIANSQLTCDRESNTNSPTCHPSNYKIGVKPITATITIAGVEHLISTTES